MITFGGEKMLNWFEMILKGLATVFIVYALMIPVLKHHNLLNWIDGFFIIILSIILLAYAPTQSYLGFAVVFGSASLLYIVLKGLFAYYGYYYFWVFNVKKTKYLDMKALIDKASQDNGIDPSQYVYQAKTYFLIKLQSIRPANLKPFYKAVEESIKKQFSYPFALWYGVFMMTFIILAKI
jgi:hypothetical protein